MSDTDHAENAAQMTEADDIRAFILSGNARFTLVSKRSGKRYTYRVSKKKGDAQPPIWFVSVLTGPDNTADYQYIGFTRGFQLFGGSKGNASHPAYRGLDYLMGWLGNKQVPGDIEFWHEGRCGRCARALTDPESIARGYGSECYGKV